MDDDTKKIMDGIERSLREISDYLTWLRQKNSVPRQALTETVDSRQPYLAGRQPRRDGDNFFTPSTGGAHGPQAKVERK